MSQMGSTGSGPGGATPISSIVTDAGTATPQNGTVTVASGTNITSTEVSNTVTLSLNSAITVTDATIGDINIATNTISSVGGNDIVLDPNGTGKVVIPSLSTNSHVTLNSSKQFNTSASMTNGSVVIGSTSGSPGVAHLTAGPGISISNGAGSVTISKSAGWQKLSYGGGIGEQQQYTMETNTGYIANSWAEWTDISGFKFTAQYPLILTLPPNDQLSIGDMMVVVSVGGGGTTIVANTNQAVFWCQYSNGTNAFPAIYYNQPGTAPIPSIGAGYGLGPGRYPSYTYIGWNGFDTAQAIWFVVTGFDGPNGGAAIYVYKIQQIWQVLYPSIVQRQIR